MSKRLHPTLADYLVIAVSPALIMALVGSLVFFLLDIFYQGQFVGRLHFVFACFVMAAVLIGRIAIEMGSGHAMGYATPLAIVTILALGRFVEYPGGAAAYSLGVNVGLVVLILWCANKLTWDCTFIDESKEESGEGVLRTMGLDPARKPPQEPPPADTPSEPKEASPKKTAAKPRPHSGGVWVVFFSLAALPLFGLGQRFLPADNSDRRRYAFLLLCIYVTSALGLLLTTSFLGLRRYLRGRRLQMPAAMAGAWVTIGCLLIAAILGFAILLPRPNAEYAVSEVPWKMTSPTRNASRYAVGKEGTHDPNQDARGGEDRQRPDAKAPKGEGSQRKSDDRDTSRSGPTREGKSSETKSGSAESKGGQQQSKDGPADQKSSQSEAEGGDSADRKGSQNQAQDDPRQSQDSSKDAASDRKSRQDRQTGSKDDARSKSNTASDRSLPASPPPPKPATSLPSWNLPLSGLLKWIFYLALILAVAYAAWKSRAALADALRDLLDSLRRLWASLFGPKQGPKKTGPSQDQAETKPAPRPFADYADPFAAGWAEQWPPDELVRYTFAALEAWGREHGCPRGPEQTVYEFAERLGDRSKPLSRHCRKMADLYSRAAYAPGTLPPSSVAPLREFWQQLTSA